MPILLLLSLVPSLTVAALLAGRTANAGRPVPIPVPVVACRRPCR